jgi:hypothetical protein
MSKSDWLSVSAANPCPVCGKDSNCKISLDGKAVYCGSNESNRKQNKGGQWLHFLDVGQSTYQAKPTDAPSLKGKSSTGKRKFPSFRHFLDSAKVHPFWCERYCVPQEIWKRLGCFGNEQELKTPEHSQDCFDAVSGVFVRRHESRASLPGSKRGVTASHIPDSNSPAVLLVEGASDTGSVLAAGLDAIGRHGKGQQLNELAKLLERVGDECPIILVVERDKQDPDEQSKLFKSECERSEQLANTLNRPVLVSSPPEGVKDFNDWWRIQTNRQGHRLSARDRHSKGKTMLRYLVDHGREILPSLDHLTNLYRQSADDWSRRIIHRVDVMREQAYVDDVDTAYQHEQSCAFFKTFYKRDEFGNHQFLTTFLACKRWKCFNCRERILRPTWRMHFCDLFAYHPQAIYRMTAANLAEAKSLRRAVARLGGQFAVLQFLEGQCAIYASQPIKRVESTLFDLRKFAKHYDELQESFMDDIARVDSTAPKPISVSREWKLIKDDRRGWTPIQSPSSPNQARYWAEQAKLKTWDISPEATAAMLDGCGVCIPNSEEGNQKLSLYKAGLFIA